MVKITWNRNETPPGYYAAVIIERSPGYFVFAAYPNAGAYCVEAVFKSLSEAQAVAEAFMAGEKPPCLYSTSY